MGVNWLEEDTEEEEDWLDEVASEEDGAMLEEGA